MVLIFPNNCEPPRRRDREKKMLDNIQRNTCNYIRVSTILFSGTMLVYLGFLFTTLNQNTMTDDSPQQSAQTIRREKFWQVFLGPPFDFMHQETWAKVDNCKRTAQWMRKLAKEEESTYDLPLQIHTEMIFQKNPTFVVDPRKNQIPVLSFLKTQRSDTILNIWIQETNNTQIPEWLSYLRLHEEYGKRLEIRIFNATKILKGLPLDLNDKTTLLKALKEGQMPQGSKSDIVRYSLLMEHGGTWFDTDTLFISDVTALTGIDFVTVTQVDFLNGAVLGTSGRHCAFMRNALTLSARLYNESPNHTNYFRYGHSLLRQLRDERPYTFRILPGCLVDSSWTRAFRPESPRWDSVFGSSKTSEATMKFMVDHVAGPFSFHWHGRWDKPMVKGSPFSTIHARYVKELRLDPAIFLPEPNEIWSGNAKPLSGPTVSCGKHFAASCADCPGLSGPGYCHGSCNWNAISKGCEPM